jgi:hypothetical protein
MKKDMPNVYMRRDPTNTALLLEIIPRWKEYRLPDGCMVVQLQRALYGLIESARLWYEEISSYQIHAY